MKTVYHSAESRGHANHGWLNTYHTFSFANYRNNNRIHFGALRVLNDDTVKGGMGFGTHPHDNMEIISIPLEGKLQHGDNMGNSGIISKGEIQVMSAGTGVTHSEKNADDKEDVKFLQIWIFPRELNVKPRYGQMTLLASDKPDALLQIVSPNKEDEGLWIHQDAWLHLGKFNKRTNISYSFKKEGNGVYVFVIEGKVKIESQVLHARDGMEISETNSFNMEILEEAEILIIEVPMKLPNYLTE